MTNRRNTQTNVKRENQIQILKTVLDEGVISRASLAKLLKMSKPAVNDHVAHLLELNMIKELGEGTSNEKGGRKPILISLNPKYSYIIAVDLNFNTPLISLADFIGEVLDKEFIDKKRDSEDIKETIKLHIDNILARNNLMAGEVGVIVISSPGIIDGKTGEIIRHPQHETICNTNIKAYLCEAFHCSVIIKNDVNMAAIGEAKYLKRNHIHQLFYVSLGLGLGSAIIINGRIYKGENNAAGEISYYMFDESGSRVETDISIQGLIDEVRNRLTAAPKTDSILSGKADRLTFEDIVSAYQESDPAVIGAIRKISRILGVIISNCVTLIDINTVVIGGDYFVFADTVIDEVQKVMKTFPLAFEPVIMPTALDYAGGTIGCFEVGLDFLIENLE